MLGRLGGRRGDRGTVAALVAVLLAGGVLLGMGALVVDVGRIYVERAELQGGADAASVAVARACVTRPDRCTDGQMSAVADDYAADNAKDGLANATVCGYVPRMSGLSGPIEDCPSGQPDNLTKCFGVRPAKPTPFIEVRTTTEVEGGTALPPIFGGAVTDTDGATVAACSRVTWGPVHTAEAELGLAICKTQFDEATMRRGVRVFQPPPVGGDHARGVNEITLRVSMGDRSCGGAPSGFVWIKHDSSGDTCPHPLKVDTDEGAAAHGRDITGGCARALEEIVRNPRPVAVAIYSSGHSGNVTTEGIAMFVPTGWRYHEDFWEKGPDPRNRRSDLSRRRLCARDPATMCLYGYFTTKIFSADTVPTDDHYGAVVVKTIG
ncbi:Tad domain-containing protein [Phytohabitans flavus]|uniref:Tad domain-containing protein n=1 Tax=Phytohabitans flavus TaxID=1076124 RepID=UPI0022B2A200|nr:Tad domain-containing protein [Phytohabitans flavus]